MCENIRARMYVCVCVSVSEYLVLPCFICTFVRIFVINTYPDSVVALFSSISYRFVNFSTTLDDITLEKKHNKCLFIIHAHSNHFTLFTLLYPLRTEQSPCRSSPNAVKVPIWSDCASLSSICYPGNIAAPSVLELPSDHTIRYTSSRCLLLESLELLYIVKFTIRNGVTIIHMS